MPKLETLTHSPKGLVCQPWKAGFLSLCSRPGKGFRQGRGLRWLRSRDGTGRHLGTDFSHWFCCRETVRREEKTGTRPGKMPR